MKPDKLIICMASLCFALNTSAAADQIVSDGVSIRAGQPLPAPPENAPEAAAGEQEGEAPAEQEPSEDAPEAAAGEQEGEAPAEQEPSEDAPEAVAEEPESVVPTVPESVPVVTFEETVREQQTQLGNAVADPLKGCGEFEWRYLERGCKLVYEQVSGFVWAFFPDIVAPLTLNEARKYLESLTISGQTGWRLPDKDALFPANLGELYDNEPEVSETDILQYRLPSVAAYSKNSPLLTGFSNNTEPGFLIAVRPFDELDRLVAGNRQFSDANQFRQVAGYLLKGQVSMDYEPPQLPAMPQYPVPPDMVKGEFEPSQQFTTRKDAAQRAYEEQVAAVNAVYQRYEVTYRQLVEASELHYLGELARMYDQIGYQRQLAVERAWQLLYGDPVIDVVAYDADAQLFRITLRSARRNFVQEITISVPIDQAPAFKARLLDKSLVPSVRLVVDSTGVVSFARMDVKTNEIRINDEYQVALKQDNMVAYQTFIDKYPSASQVVDAKIRIAGLEKAAADRQAEIEAMATTERAKRAEVERAEMEKYTRIKSVGDKICMSMRYLLFFNRKVTGYVEAVSGNRIHIRIADTAHQDVRYNGLSLEPNMLIWDNFNNWKHYE
ncbi:MAG: hypothetical protein HGA97_10825 [Chlorobiaceae bacterium]|nr:hypothetical protein [Chlorobiaceae bacterium]